MIHPRDAALPWTTTRGAEWSTSWQTSDSVTLYVETLQVQIRRGGNGDSRDELVAAYPAAEGIAAIDITGTDFDASPKVLALRISATDTATLLDRQPHWISATCTIDGEEAQTLIPIISFVVLPQLVAS